MIIIQLYMRFICWRYAILAVFFLYFSAPNVHAEFSCTADIRYKWRLDAVEPNTDKPSSEASPAPVDTVSPSADVTDPVRDIFWQAVESKGANEEEAKQKLKALINERRGKADAACRDAHENQSSCLANKFAQVASLQGSLTFSQRKELEKKIVSDCAVTSGQCLGSASTEPVCREIVAAQAAPAENAESGAAKGKENKKENKKK